MDSRHSESENVPVQGTPGSSKMDKFKDGVQKAIPYIVDVLFGAMIMYFIYIYCLFRFKVKFFVGNEPVDPDSPLGRFVSSLFLLFSGYVAQNAGNPTSELIRQTIAFLMNFIKIRFGGNNPMANPGAVIVSQDASQGPNNLQ